MQTKCDYKLVTLLALLELLPKAILPAKILDIYMVLDVYMVQRKKTIKNAQASGGTRFQLVNPPSHDAIR
jgi:hypothetical protein